MDPVLEAQMALDSGGLDADITAAPPLADEEQFHLGGDVRVPRAVALMLAGAVGGLLVLRLTGFRFSFGANIGGGK